MSEHERRADPEKVLSGWTREISGTYSNILFEIKEKHFSKPLVHLEQPECNLWDAVDPRYWYMFDPKIWFEICGQPKYQSSMYSIQQRLIHKAGPTLRERIEESLKKKRHPPTVTYIDLGVGSGEIANMHLREIADYVGKYVAVDIIPEYLDQAVMNVKGNFPKSTLRQSFENLNLPDSDNSIYLFEIGPTYGNFEHERIDDILLRNMREDGISLVSAQIVRDEHDKRLIMQAYKEGGLNERMLMSLLDWLGFKKEDFMFKYYFRNSYITIAAVVNNVPRSIQDTSLRPGDYIELFRSWKPKRPEFERVLSRCFDIDTVYTDTGDYRFAILRKKKQESFTLDRFFR